MREMAAAEAKTKLGHPLDEAERGEAIPITRRGKAGAKTVPAAPGFDREKPRRAVAGVREIGAGLTLGGLSIKGVIDERRR